MQEVMIKRENPLFKKKKKGLSPVFKLSSFFNKKNRNLLSKKQTAFELSELLS